MSFTRAKPAGWTDDVDTVTATQLNHIDVNQSRAIDGTAGGTYTPSSVIAIGGSAGLRLEATGSGARLLYSSRSGNRQLAMLGFTVSGNWGLDNTPALAWRNTASGGTLWLALEGLPDNAVLDTVSIRWKGAAGHGALPVLPNIQVFRVDNAGVETALAAATTDPSATVGAYEAYHDITTGSLAHTIDRSSYRYLVKVVGETGGNFVANAHVVQLKASCTITNQPEGW